jgi:hypothetical protein
VESREKRPIPGKVRAGNHPDNPSQMNREHDFSQNPVRHLSSAVPIMRDFASGVFLSYI